MNKNLKEAFFKQKVRKIHKDALKKVLVEQEHNLYTTFIQPFTDVIDAAKLTGQDILNSLRLSFDLLTTLSHKKREAAINKFDKRKAKIEEKWKPITDRNMAAMANADLDVIALVFFPAAFITSEAAAATWKSAGSMHDYLVDSGWRIPLVSTILGRPADDIGPGSGKDRDKTTHEDPAEKKKSLLGRLAGLFYIEGSWHAGDLITEQDEENPKKEPDFKKAITKYFEETGLTTEFEKSAKELLNAQNELMDDILEDALPRLKLLSTLTQTANIDEFIEAIDNARSEIDLKATGMDKIKQDMEESATKLMQSEEFKKQIADELGINPPAKEGDDQTGTDTSAEIPQDKLEDAAKNVAFANAKQNFDEKLRSGKNKLKEEALQLVEEQSPNKESMAMIKGSTQGLKYIKIIEDAKQKIQNS